MKILINEVQKMQVLLYHMEDTDATINAIVQNDTLWITQKAMAELFDVTTQTISRHLSNVYQEGELSEAVTCTKIVQVQIEGDRNVKRSQSYYNLDAIISVGYRVNSHRATQFRIWATKVLNEYIRKGFVLDDERLKQGKAVFGKDYFRELLERVRSIRASERRIWLQITDIFAECSIDYDKNSQAAKDFYAMVQNKFHYAITGQTAAEIIWQRANHEKKHMGLTTWKSSPDGRILISDVTVAKNYLSHDQIHKLERLVSGFFDYIEDLIERENSFTMKEFAKCVDDFINFRRYQVLHDRGRISKKQADARAKEEYKLFNPKQKIESDFDRLVKKLEKK